MISSILEIVAGGLLLTSGIFGIINNKKDQNCIPLEDVTNPILPLPEETEDND